jgi:hypothetical protein
MEYQLLSRYKERITTSTKEKGRTLEDILENTIGETNKKPII